MKVYFISFVAYIFLTVFFLFSGITYYGSSLGSGTTDLSSTFLSMFQILIILVPFLSMRLFTEEKSQKTDQLLLTSPVKLTEIVMGKFLAAFSIFMIGALITLVYAVIMSFYSKVIWPVYFSNLIGILLIGATFISLGMFISVFSENQFTAAIFTIVIIFIWTLIDSVYITWGWLSWLNGVIGFLSLYRHYFNFTIGIFNFTSILFFLSFCFVFIFLTTRILEKRRWS